MTYRSAIVGLIVGGLLTLPLAAEAAKPKPTSKQIAAARARGDAMIAATGAPELFRNITNDDAPRVVHLPSRMLCHFDAKAGGDSIEIGAGQDRDDVVSCVTKDGGTVRRLSASRAGGTGAAEERAQAKVAALRSAQPDAGPVEKPDESRSWKLKIPLAAYSFETEKGGKVTTTNVSAIDAREWALTQETTLAGSNAEATSMVAQTLSEIYLTLALYEMAGVTKNGEPVNPAS